MVAQVVQVSIEDFVTQLPSFFSSKYKVPLAAIGPMPLETCSSARVLSALNPTLDKYTRHSVRTFSETHSIRVEKAGLSHFRK